MFEGMNDTTPVCVSKLFLYKYYFTFNVQFKKKKKLQSNVNYRLNTVNCYN